MGSQLRGLGHEVWGVRRDASAATELKERGITPLIGDLTTDRFWAALPHGFNAVITAASSKGGGAAGYRTLYLEGTRRALNWGAGQPITSWVHLSSTSVYGQTAGEWVNEASPTEPLNETSQILVQTERELLATAASRDGFPVTILRSAGIYGPGRGHLFQQFVAGTAHLTGSGTRWLNMIHRDDLARAATHCLLHPQGNRVLNTCDDEPVTERDFFQWLAERLGRPLPPSLPAEERSRKRGTTDKRVSNAALKVALGAPLLFPTFREGYGPLCDPG